MPALAPVEQGCRPVQEVAKTRSWDIATKTARNLERDLELEALGIEPIRTADHITIESGTDLYLGDMAQRGIKDPRRCASRRNNILCSQRHLERSGIVARYVRRVDLGSGLISTVAGSGHTGETVEGSSALSANFWAIDGSVGYIKPSESRLRWKLVSRITFGVWKN
jgi:hypothetical protein